MSAFGVWMSGWGADETPMLTVALEMAAPEAFLTVPDTLPYCVVGTAASVTFCVLPSAIFRRYAMVGLAGARVPPAAAEGVEANATTEAQRTDKQPVRVIHNGRFSLPAGTYTIEVRFNDRVPYAEKLVAIAAVAIPTAVGAVARRGTASSQPRG